MAETTKIEWARNNDGTPGATFNPWVGCTKVGPGCDHCYAESWAKRSGQAVWGPHARRRRTSEQNWKKPLKWNREAIARGIRIRVFCASLADVFDNAADPAWRGDLWAMIRATPNLDWIIVTKRAGNIAKMLPDDWGDGYPNVWLLITICTQEEADRDIGKFVRIPAVVHGLSVEPMLGPVDFAGMWIEHPNPGMHINMLERLDWVIAGGESGPGARPMHPAWPRTLRDQCQATGVAFFFKQWGEWVAPGYQPDPPVADAYFWPFRDERTVGPISYKIGKTRAGRALDGRIWSEMPGGAG